MATNFPSSVDSFTNPTTSDTLATVPHASQHADVNDAVEAIETALLDGAPLHIDDANERVGIGTTSPAGRLTVYSNASTGNGDEDNYLMMDRPSTSYESSVNWATAGTKKWFLGTDNTGNDDILLYDWAGSKIAFYGDSSTGIITFPNQPAFKAHASIASYTNGSILTYVSASYNRGNHLNTGTGVFTAPVAGVYAFYGMIRADQNAGYIHSNVYINGVNARQTSELPGVTGYFSSASGGFIAGAFTYSRYLNANDGISFNMTTSGGGTYTVNGQTFIAGHLVG